MTDNLILTCAQCGAKIEDDHPDILWCTCGVVLKISQRYIDANGLPFKKEPKPGQSELF